MALSCLDILKSLGVSFLAPPPKNVKFDPPPGGVPPRLAPNRQGRSQIGKKRIGLLRNLTLDTPDTGDKGTVGS